MTVFLLTLFPTFGLAANLEIETQNGKFEILEVPADWTTSFSVEGEPEPNNDVFYVFYAGKLHEPDGTAETYDLKLGFAGEDEDDFKVCKVNGTEITPPVQAVAHPDPSFPSFSRQQSEY